MDSTNACSSGRGARLSPMRAAHVIRARSERADSAARCGPGLGPARDVDAMASAACGSAMKRLPLLPDRRCSSRASYRARRRRAVCAAALRTSSFAKRSDVARELLLGGGQNHVVPGLLCVEAAAEWSAG